MTDRFNSTRTGRAGRRTRRLGLTLTEMLVVMGIFGLLAGLLVPVLLRSRSKARGVVCANNLKGLGQAYTVCLTESSGYMPDTYYAFEETDEGFSVVVKTLGETEPDGFFKYGQSNILACPSDDKPVNVLVASTHGAEAAAPASYGYNVSLPLMFENAARVRQPVNTVTFYDGDPAGVVGPWTHHLGWAGDTIRKRHLGQANYLYLDGHVEPSPAFPDLAFEGGGQLLAWDDNDSNPDDGGYPGDGGGGGGGSDDPPPDDPPPDDPPPDPVDFDIVDGEVIPNEPVTATILCLGAAFQNGPNGPRIPVWAYYRLNDDSKTLITKDVHGGERVTLPGVDSGTRISLTGKTRQFIKAEYSSNTDTDHCWVMRDGDVVPTIAGYAGQAPIEDFLQNYIDEEGLITLGPNDAIFLFEMYLYTDYHRYSTADFQDLVVLVSFTQDEGVTPPPPGEDNSTSTVGGSININPNNNNTFEFFVTLPNGRTVTRDDLHADEPLEGDGFHPDHLEYTGPATIVRVKPKGNGNQNGLTVDGEPYGLENKNRYIISSDAMDVHLYNTKRNPQGKAMGKWWIEIDAEDATITIE